VRFVAVLACLTVVVTLPALAADPPEAQVTSGNDATPAVQEAAAVPSADAAAVPAEPAAATTAATAAPADAEPDLAQLEKRMHAMGYATVMRNGQKVFCRRDEVLGTRLGVTYHCMTPNEARTNRQQQDFEVLQQRLMTTCVQAGAHKPANCGN
jgi:hypothetical protein